MASRMTSTTECYVTFPPEMLPAPDEGQEAEVIVDGKVIWRTGEGYTMNDWARKIAAKLEVGIEGQEPEQFIYAMSKALRKAKADAFREAVVVMFDNGYDPKRCNDVLLEAASKLDPPTT